jgi:hypothetical protein
VPADRPGQANGRLAGLFAGRFAKGRQLTKEAASQISDLQFTQAYRVPFRRVSITARSFLQNSFSTRGVIHLTVRINNRC